MSKQKMFLGLVGLFVAFGQISFAKGPVCYSKSDSKGTHRGELLYFFQTLGQSEYGSCSGAAIGRGFYRSVNRFSAIDKTYWELWTDENVLSAMISAEDKGDNMVDCIREQSLTDSSDISYRMQVRKIVKQSGGMNTMRIDMGPDQDGFCAYTFETLDAKQSTAQQFVTHAFAAYSMYLNATTLQEEEKGIELAFFYMDLVNDLAKSK